MIAAGGKPVVLNDWLVDSEPHGKVIKPAA
jgi:hypothetical protein